ncbi:MAG: type I 3-dehydroquinate dehydratase [Bacillota bacterium]|nr:type I 3-dehydroquinate dehydratase [Bacillota bacterium]
MRNMKVKGLTLEQGRPKIAAIITGKNHDEILNQVSKAMLMPCDLLEWRADYFFGEMEGLDDKIEKTEAHMEMIRVLDDIDYKTESMPIIFSLRTKNYGGRVKTSKENIYDLATLAAQSRLVDFVDVELFDDDGQLNKEQVLQHAAEVHSFNVKVIHSYHEYSRVLTYDETVNLALGMRAMGADIVRIVTRVDTLEQSKALLNAAAVLTEGDNDPALIIGTGQAGVPTRIAGGTYGSCIAFAYVEEPTTDGQFDVKALAETLDKYYV